MSQMAIENHDNDQQSPQPRRAIRTIREKEVAEVTRVMLQDEVDLPDIQASLHRTIRRYGNTAHVEREVITALLESNYLLAKALRIVSQDLAQVSARLGAIESQRKI
jgi:hypothetical protein